MNNREGQISIEYLIIVGFVTFIVIGLLGVAFFYVSEVNDKIKLNQIDKFGKNIASTADVVFYAGVPSQQTIEGYLPKGVSAIGFYGNEIVFNVSTSSGFTQISFSSKVNFTGGINNTEGFKKVRIIALEDAVSVNGN